MKKTIREWTTTKEGEQAAIRPHPAGGLTKPPEHRRHESCRAGCASPVRGLDALVASGGGALWVTEGRLIGEVAAGEGYVSDVQGPSCDIRRC